MKILFASNDAISLPVIKSLNPFGILTVKSKESGRKKRINPISEWARENGKVLFEVEQLKSQEREEIGAHGFDMLISFSFSKIFGPKFLSLFNKGAFNIHPSALPEFRGPSPIQASILKGLKKTRITLQTIALGMDEGDIVRSVELDIDEKDDFVSLSEKVGNKSVELIKEFYSSYPEYELQKQQGEPSYTTMIEKSEGCIDFNENIIDVERKIRAYSVFPRMHCIYNNKRLFFITATAEEANVEHEPGKVVEFDKKKGFKICFKNGYLYVTSLQMEAKAVMDARSFYNGNNGLVGTVLNRGIQ